MLVKTPIISIIIYTSFIKNFQNSSSLSKKLTNVTRELSNSLCRREEKFCYGTC